MKEIWRDIKGYEGLYQVSNYGNVRSMNYSRTKRVKELKLNKTNGYLRVILRKDKQSTSRAVHRLVAEAFIPNINDLPEVNHKDECKTNNNVDNLEWCTRVYNINYGTANKRRAETRIKNGTVWKNHFTPFTNKEICARGGRAKNKKKKIIQCNLDGTLVREWESAKDTEAFGFDSATVTKCCKEKRKTHKSFIWKYKD